MFNNQRPDTNDLPSTTQLLRSTVIALITAGVLLVTVVMPSEYALDPTGVGRVLGLTQMGELKATLAQEAAAEEAAQPVATTPAQAPVQQALNSRSRLSQWQNLLPSRLQKPNQR